MSTKSWREQQGFAAQEDCEYGDCDQHHGDPAAWCSKCIASALTNQGVDLDALETKTLKRVADLRRQMNTKAKEQSAWLIERRDMNTPSWLTWRSGWSWTSDACDAIKFADEKSARLVTKDPRLRYAFPVYICEHSWPEGF